MTAPEWVPPDAIVAPPAPMRVRAADYGDGDRLVAEPECTWRLVVAVLVWNEDESGIAAMTAYRDAWGGEHWCDGCLLQVWVGGAWRDAHDLADPEAHR